jgi:hypothetical protein
MKYLFECFIVVLVIILVFSVFLTLRQLGIEQQQAVAAQKQDYFDCIKKVNSALDQVSWCYDKFIECR